MNQMFALHIKSAMKYLNTNLYEEKKNEFIYWIDFRLAKTKLWATKHKTCHDGTNIFFSIILAIQY